jgi:hypothetical protein
MGGRQSKSALRADVARLAAENEALRARIAALTAEDTPAAAAPPALDLAPAAAPPGARCVGVRACLARVRA